MSADFDSWAELYPTLADLDDSDDADFYRSVGRRCARPFVDLGIGVGRLARHLRPDVGVDISIAMLRESRRRLGDSVRLVRASIADYRLDQPAGFSYAAQNTLNHAGADLLSEAFANVYQNTLPGGRFAFETAAPRPDRLRVRDRLPVLRAFSPTVAIYDITRVTDLAAHRVEIIGCRERLDRDGKVTERRYFPPIAFTFLPVPAVAVAATAAGWQVESVHGDFTGAPIVTDSPTAVWCLRRPAAPPMRAAPPLPPHPASHRSAPTDGAAGS